MASDSDDYGATRQKDRYSADWLDEVPVNSCDRIVMLKRRNCWGKPVIPYISFVLLGIAPQLTENMIFSEAPLMATFLPEGKALQAHIVAAFMIANAITLLYLLLQSFRPVPDVWALVFVLAGGFLASIILSVWWDVVIKIGKHQVSVPLMISCFLAGAAGNTSILIGFSFAAQYKEIFVSALSAGFGLSGLVPSLLTFVQETGAHYPLLPRFGPSVWFLSSGFMTIIFSLSLFHIITEEDIKDPEQVRHTFMQSYKLLPGESAINEVDVPAKQHKVILRIGECLVMMLIASVSTFLIPGSLPYMGETQSQLVWMNIIFLVAPTIGTAGAAFIRPFKRSRIVPWTMITLQTILFVYIFLTVLKHTRPYVYHGLPLIFTSLILFAILSGYNSTMVYLILRQEEVVETAMVESAQRWAGFAFQIGGLLGIAGNLGALHNHLYQSAS